VEECRELRSVGEEWEVRNLKMRDLHFILTPNPLRPTLRCDRRVNPLEWRRLGSVRV
jgi:hypothetical protein